MSKRVALLRNTLALVSEYVVLLKNTLALVSERVALLRNTLALTRAGGVLASAEVTTASAGTACLFC